VWRLHQPRQPRVCILNYHSVHPDRTFRTCTPEVFETHLAWLNFHCRVVPFEDVLSRNANEAGGARPTVTITFDDGYKDNYEYAFPALRKYDMSATLFLTAGFVQRDPAVMERFRLLRRIDMTELEPLTWDQVQEMSRYGVDVQAHTYSHPNLVHLDRAERAWEIVDARAMLEDKIGKQVSGFAYPFGKPGCHFNRAVEEEVRKAGYRYAVSVTERGMHPGDNNWRLPRIIAPAGSLAQFSERIAGAWDFLGYYQEALPVWMGRLLHPEAFRKSRYGGSYREIHSRVTQP
jgi:peptidoglycan/xylan/chitin deacetylase (PgdA/CDA1 family)